LFSINGYVYNRNSAGAPVAKPAGEGGHGSVHFARFVDYCASGLIANGCDVVTVQHALGHSSASITLNVYSHLWPKAEDRTRAAAANLMASTTVLADSVRTQGRFRAGISGSW
jgi:integrase